MVYGDRWSTLRVLGKGGQGDVFLVNDVSGRSDQGSLIEGLQQSMTQLTGAGTREIYSMSGIKFIAAIDEIVNGRFLPRGALKRLLPIDEAVNAATAVARMKTELDVLRSVDHPALIKVFDKTAWPEESRRGGIWVTA
jgi:serine/threonine protein kinase